MPNDAKLGLVLGLGLVVLISLVFFRKDAATAHPPETKAGQVAVPKAPAHAPELPPLPPLPPIPDLPPADPLLDPPPLPGTTE